MNIVLTEGMVESMPDTLRDDCERRLTALIESGHVNDRTIGLTIAHAAMAGYQQGRVDALAELLTTQQVADTLGIDVSRVRALARQRQVGWLIGVDRLYRPEDVDALRERRPAGRPKKTG